MPLELDDQSRAAHPMVTDYGVDARGFTYRAVTSAEDAKACVALQSEIWGSAFDQVPASLMRIVTSIGGLAIGAFAPSGELVGFVFSLVGMHNGEPIHWSHMLGVREEVRGAGVGRHLKELQREELSRRGISRVLWTFDPLQARNAHLNFNRLGVRIIDYVENMYGITASPLHHGLPTDRIVVMLPTTAGEHAERRERSNGSNGKTPVLTPFPRPGDVTADVGVTSAPSLLIEIPSDLQRVIAATPDVASTWRFATRTSFLTAIRRGYEIVGLRRDLTSDRAFYTLAAPTSGD